MRKGYDQIFGAQTYCKFQKEYEIGLPQEQFKGCLCCDSIKKPYFKNFSFLLASAGDAVVKKLKN